MKGYTEYLENLVRLIEKVKDCQCEKFEKAADIIADAIQEGRMVHFWGPGGHSSMFAEDVLYREGELACINPIVDPSISLGHGALKEINYFERIEAYAKAILKYNRVKSGDIMVMGSAYGVNPVCIQAAIECKKNGIYLIAITSPLFAQWLDNEETRHTSGKGLYEIADLYIHSYAPEDDLTLKMEGSKEKFGSVATIMQLLTCKAMTSTVIVKLIKRGVKVPIWRDALEEGGAEFNEQYMKKYWSIVKSM
ncbi:MAG: sugar isomerase domain-containing protein [Clostridiaceae bacterium]|nr:sugar isomerase domain-containing protein [Clostridiaceae bacterium]